MAKIHIENGIISSSADYGLYHGTSEIAKVEAGGLRVQGDVTAENLIVSSSVTFMTQSFSSGSTIFGDTAADDTHQFTGSVSITGSGGLSVTDGNILSHGQYAIDIDGDHTGGPRITMGDYDSTPDNFMLFGAFSSINNILTQARDFRIYDSGGFTGFYFDVSENKVGIGTESPDGTLHVHTGTAGTMTAHVSADDLVVEKDDHGGISILTPNNRTGAIYFGDVEDNNIGALHYNHSLNKFIITVAAADRFSLSANTAEFASTITKISGSATSTGSFGQGRFVDNVYVGTDFDGSRGDELVVFGTSYFKLMNEATAQFQIQHNAGGDNILQIDTDPNYFNIDPTGNNEYKVGIGTASPDNVLHVSTGDNIVAKFESTDANATLYLVDNNTSNASTFKRTSNDLKILENGGNVLFPGTNVKVSGSATSTGSFGALTVGGAAGLNYNIVDGKLGINSSGPDKTLVVQDSGAEVVIADTGTIPTLRFREGGATKGVVRTSGGDMQLYSGGSSAGNLAVTIDTSQNAIFAGSKISGSSTSTGSFGAGRFTEKVGIGITNPQAALHVESEAANVVLRVGDNSAGIGLDFSYDTAGYTEAAIYNRYASNDASKMVFGFGLALSDAPVMTLLKSGNVGIGTESPGEKLELKSSSDTDKTRLKIVGGTKGFTLGKTGQAQSYVHLRPMSDGQVMAMRLMPHTSDNDTYLELWGHDYETDTTNFARGMLVLKQSDGNAFQIISDGNGSESVGDIEFIIENGSEPSLSVNSTKISGSASTTGSFGHGYIDNKLGIGLTNPASPLHIRTSTNENLEFEEASGNLRISALNDARSANVELQFAASQFHFLTGNVGIGDTSPSGLTNARVLDVKNTSTGAGTHAQLVLEGSNGHNFLSLFSGDDSTGGDPLIMYDSGHVLRFGPADDAAATNFSEKMRIDASGNVGIGTILPTQKLEISAGNIMISGSGGAGVIFKGTADGSNKNALYFKNASNTEKFRIIHDPSANGTNDLQFKANANSVTVMTMLQNGNVGIGDDTPSAKLHIKGGTYSDSLIIQSSGANGGIRFMDSGDVTDGYVYATNDGQIGFLDKDAHWAIRHQNSGVTEFRSNNTITATIDSSGNFLPAGNVSGSSTSTGSFGSAHIADKVGIGTTSPTKTLEVDGSYNLGSNAFINYNATYPYTINVENTAGVGNLTFQAGTGATGYKSKIELQGGNTATDASITLTTADDPRMTILNSGNVGIGTTSPGSLLTIADTGDISTSTFISGITGDGFRIEDNGSDGTFLEVDNIFVRNTLRTHIFQKDVVKATNGILFISDSGVISGSSQSGGTVTFEDEKSATFSDNDILFFKDVNDSGTINGVRFQINGSGTSAGGFTTYNVDNVSGDLDNINVGGTAARISGGTVTIDASTTHSPFIDVNASSGSSVMRMGKLTGITSPRFDTLSGFGIWASGSAYFEGNVNATAGNIGGWGISGNAITSSAGIISIDANTKRITINDGSNDRIYLGEVTGSSTYGLKIFDGTGTNDSDLLVELGSGRNQIVGWELTPGRFQYNDAGGSIALDAGEQQVSVFTGSINTARPKVVMGKLPRVGGSAADDRYGFAVFAGDDDADITDDQTYNVLITRDKARLAGWDLVPGNIQSDNTFGSVRLSSISQSLTIWTGSVNEAQPKLVLGKLPLHDGTVDSPYGLAVFSGSGTVSGSEASASVLITANKARLAGWELVPGQLKSGTVARIDGNEATIALGANADQTHTTAQDNLFYVSASATPTFFVGSNFSFINNTLTAAGWTIDTQAITKTVSTDTKGVSLNSGASVLLIHGTDGKDNFAGTGKNNVRVGVGRVGVNKFGIAGFDGSGNELFKLGEDGNEIAGWTIDTAAISKNDVKLDSTANGEGLYVKKTSFSSTTAGGFLGLDSGTAKFNVGNGSKFIKFDGTNFTVDAGNFELDSSGNMTATSATLTGTVTATAGTIGGFNIANNAISSSATFKRGLQLKPGEAIRGYGDTAHKTRSVVGKFTFGLGSIAPAAGADEPFDPATAPPPGLATP